MAKWILATMLWIVAAGSLGFAEQGSFCSSGQKQIEFSCNENAVGPGWTQGTDGCLYRDVGDCKLVPTAQPPNLIEPHNPPLPPPPPVVQPPHFISVYCASNDSHHKFCPVDYPIRQVVSVKNESKVPCIYRKNFDYSTNQVVVWDRCQGTFVLDVF